jgi:lipopolysaccharide/colanic/teichoic acid biosynthesis glycosyltransferase
MIRFFDVLFSFLGLLILSPIVFILALCIKFTSKGPVFYKQQRVGRYGKTFTLLKFRSMYIGSDKKGLLTVGGRDPRITPIGYFIRKYKLDELPQLWNVFVGEMSIVGPRPEVAKYVDLYNDEQRKILNARPGITDMASIKFSNENEILDKQPDPERYYIEQVMPEKITLNYIFIQRPTIRKYFTIIFLTAKKIFSSK